MKRHGLYGVFHSSDGTYYSGKWGLTRNKRTAIKAARKFNGEVRRMDLPYGNGPWDAPTFRACSERIADFRR